MIERCTCGHLKSRHPWRTLEYRDEQSGPCEGDSQVCCVRGCGCESFISEKTLRHMQELFAEAEAAKRLEDR